MENKITEIGISKIKMLSIKKFNSKKTKLKKFLTQIKLKIKYKGIKLPLVAD